MSNEPLDVQIRGWLAKQGYPFELQVGRAFAQAGWKVEHASLYVDPETGKSREIDIVATTETGSPTHGLVGISWAVECKRSVDKPWIVFTSAQNEAVLSISPYYFSPGVNDVGVLYTATQLGAKVPSFCVPNQIGHGIVRALTDSKTGDPTAPYSALLGAATAAGSLSREAASFWLRAAGETAVIKVYIPLVVLQGRLFELQLDDAGEETLTEVTRSVVWCRSPFTQKEAILVNVITESEVRAFAEQSAKDCGLILERTLPQAPELWREFRESVAARGL